MNFSSIKEYFYKVYNVCYLLMLLPLGIFIFIYFQLQQKKIIPIVEDGQQVLLLAGAALLVSVINLTTVHWLTLKRLRTYVQLAGLGVKLDKYYEIIFLRFAAGATCSLLMAIGLMLTASEYFAGLFVLVLCLHAIQWPTSGKACRALKLKGDEYTMVYNKTETF